MARDRFGFGTSAPDPSAPSREQIADWFLGKYSFNNEELSRQITNFLSTPYKGDRDIAEVRKILKVLFPESGLLTKKNKKTGKKQLLATWTGQADEEGIEKFDSYRRISKELFMAKGIPPEMLRED